LQYIFELELLLIASIALSFLITVLLGNNDKIRHIDSVGNNSGIIEKYRIFSTIINLKPEVRNRSNETPEIDNDFVNNFLTLKTFNSELKGKSYGIIDDFIKNFNAEDNYLNSAKEKLHLKNLFIKKRYSDYINKYNNENFGFYYNAMLLKSYLNLKDEKRSIKIFKDLYISHDAKKIREYISEKEITGLMNNMDQSFWNRKLEIMIKNNRLSDFRNISKYIKDRHLVNFISAEIAYTKKRYSGSKALLSRIRSARFTAGKEKLLLKMRIRDDDFSNIDQTLEKIMSDKAIYKQLLLDVASLFLIKGETDLSIRYFTRYISAIRGNGNNYNNNYWRALWVSAWLKIKSGDEKGAAELFLEGSRSPVLSYQIANLFWVSFTKGKMFPGIREFPFTYYYARFSQTGNGGKKLDLSNFKKLFNKKSSALFINITENIKTLLKSGLSNDAIEYISWIKKNEELSVEDMNSVKLIETLIYLKLGDHYYTFISFKNNFPDYSKIILPNFLKEIYLPMRYEKIIDKYSSEYNVSKELILALINRESMFRPNIISPAKAKGLMQMIDRTASQTARKVKIRLRRNDIYKPEINIRLGVAHLKELLDKYNGKIYLALAAYNAGSHRVKQWLEDFGNFTEEKFIEMIPFSETRNYVKNILRNYFYYKYYYNPDEWGNIKI